MKKKVDTNVKRVSDFIRAKGYPEYLNKTLVDCIFKIAYENNVSLESIMNSINKQM